MPPEPGWLLVRAAGDARIGTGHVMRCLALSQAWIDRNGRVAFAMREAPAGLRSVIQQEGIDVHLLSGTDDPAATLALARRLGAQWIVLDGYDFGADYQQRVHDAGFRLLAVDDYGHAQRYAADLILNQNIHASEDTYRSRATHTRLLLGTRYALLRREFRRHRDFRREIPERVRHILVTLGGADPDNVTGLVLEALRDLPGGPYIRVVVGPVNPHRAALQRAAGPGVELLESPDMPELMAWADMAVTAAGTTTWELLFMQVPLVALAVADNQLPSAHRMQELGLAETLVFSTGLSPQQIREPALRLMQSAEERRRLAALGRDLVDGDGVERVLEAMRQPD